MFSQKFYFSLLTLNFISDSSRVFRQFVFYTTRVANLCFSRTKSSVLSIDNFTQTIYKKKINLKKTHYHPPPVPPGGKEHKKNKLLFGYHLKLYFFFTQTMLLIYYVIKCKNTNFQIIEIQGLENYIPECMT